MGHHDANFFFCSILIWEIAKVLRQAPIQNMFSVPILIFFLFVNPIQSVRCTEEPMATCDIRDVLFLYNKRSMDIQIQQTGCKCISKCHSDPQLEFPHRPPSIAIIVVET